MNINVMKNMFNKPLHSWC